MIRTIQTAKVPADWLSETYCHPPYMPTAARPLAVRALYLPRCIIAALVTGVWHLVVLPFRILVGVLNVLRRVAGVLIGFSLMVVGIALWASSLFILGIPLFIVGLLLTLRCLG